MTARANSSRDQNFTATLIAVDSTDPTKTVAVEADPTTGELLVQASVSVTAADGAIVDGGGSGNKASVIESSAVPGKFGLVALNPDGSNISGGGGGSDTQYTDGNAAPANPVGTIPVFNNGGTINAVSLANPLPVSVVLPSSDSGTPIDVNITDNSGGTLATELTLQDVDANSAALAGTVQTDGTPNNGSLLQVGGNDGTNAHILKTNASGQLDVRPLTSSDNVTIANSSLAVTGTFWQATQPVSAASLPLPTGAATAAKQPALGTAGSASADVITVQGIASMTPVKTDGSGVTQPVSGTVTANAGTNLNTSALALESGGNLATLAGGVSSSKYQINNAQIAGNTISTDVGASGNGTQRVVIANSAGRALQSKSGSASSSGNNTLIAAGTNRLKIFAFTLSTTSTTAVTVKFQDGASGTDLWSVILQAPSSVSTGANLAVTPPAFLFATSSATLLNLNLSSANAVQWSVSYFDEA